MLKNRTDGFHVYGWMVNGLGLNGWELVIYAIINSFSQSEKGMMTGGISYLQDWTGLTRMTVRKYVSALENRGLIKTTRGFDEKGSFVYMSIVADALKDIEGGWQNFDNGVAKNYPLGGKNLATGGQEISHRIDDRIDDEDVCINTNTLSNREGTKSKKPKFVPPTIEEVRGYCFERGSKVDAEAFVAFYESNGWKVGRNPMKDWKAAVRTWEKREAQHPTSPSPSAPYRKESYVESAYRTYDKLFGTNLHEQKYGKK